MEAVKLEVLKEKMEQTRAALMDHLREEEHLTRAIEDLDMLSSTDDRREQVFAMFTASKALAEATKEIKTQAGRIEKRFAEISVRLGSKVFEECNGIGGKIVTENWEGSVQGAKSKVVITDLKAVPRKYRTPPKPLPTPDKWAVNKNLIYTTLSTEQVKSIPGVKLEDGFSVRVNPR